MKVTTEHKKLANKVCRAFTFKNIEDSDTIITVKQAEEAMEEVQKLKPELLNMFTKEYTLKIRKENLTPKEYLTALRQLLRFFGKHLRSKRKYRYNKEAKRSRSVFHYNII